MASEKQVHQARMALAFREAIERQRGFREIEISPSHVVYIFGGYHIRYEFYQGKVVRVGQDHAYLQPADYAYLFKLAEQQMTANIAGLNKNKKNVPKKVAGLSQQLSLPFFNPGQRVT